MKSQIPGFYKWSVEERRAYIAEQVGLSKEETQALAGEPSLPLAVAEQLVENVVGRFQLPLGIGTNFQINGNDVLIPMVVEESSVVAAASNAAKLLRAGGGLHVECTPPIMIGQVQLMEVTDLARATAKIEEATPRLLEEAATYSAGLVRRGGGPRGIELRSLPPLEPNDPLGPILVVHILLDVCDAMGANAVNHVCEKLAPTLESLSGGRARLRILSNLTDRRLVHVTGKIPFEAFCKKGQPLCYGEETARGIEEASIFAERDPYRAATHNKGIMNGVDAVMLATGQDTRAIEAGAHAYAAQKGRYTALSQWRVRDGALHGTMTLPLAVGTVGGITRVHPTVQVALRILGIEKASELAGVAASVGLAQNVAALRALAMEGIQQGHMRLHARNLAVEIGARGSEIENIAETMAQTGTIKRETAQTLLEQLRRNS